MDGKGGVATLIKNNLDFEVILNSSNNLNELFQYIKIKIGNLVLVNIYNAPNNILDNIVLNQVFKINKEDKLVIMGDLNAHHQIWGSNKNNINGLRIAEYINKYNYIILNESISTRMNRPGENISPLDLTIVSQNISCISEWKILNDTGNSDHFPTVCSIGNSLNIHNSIPNILKRNYSLANWEGYSDFIESSLNVSIQNSFENLMELINSSADKHIPYFKTKSNNRLPNNVWWDDECTEAINLRKNRIRNFKQFPSLDNYIDTKRTIARVKRFF